MILPIVFFSDPLPNCVAIQTPKPTQFGRPPIGTVIPVPKKDQCLYHYGNGIVHYAVFSKTVTWLTPCEE